MNENPTIQASPQVTSTPELLATYRSFVGDPEASSDDLFAFLTTPTAKREEFYALYCNFTYSTSNTIVQPTLSLK